MDPRIRARRPHAGLRCCVEEIDRRRPNLGHIPCESANVRNDLGTEPNRRYADLQGLPEKQSQRRGQNIGLTYGPVQRGSLPPYSIWIVGRSVLLVHADTGRKHACFYGGR